MQAEMILTREYKKRVRIPEKEKIEEIYKSEKYLQGQEVEGLNNEYSHHQEYHRQEKEF